MVFSNLLFIYLFLPLNLIFYFRSKSIAAKNRVMLIFSLIFYAWGEPKYVFLLIAMSLADWFLALQIDKRRGETGAKLFLALAVIVNIGLIGIFKYSGLVAQTTQSLFGFPESIPNIALPIGISFYTFQLLTYVVDVYRGDAEAQYNYSRVLLYAGLFHQCIAGPIVRYRDINEEIISRHTNFTRLGLGINRFAVGLAKKALLANVCGKVCDILLIADADISNAQMLSENLSTLASRSAVALWAGMFFYMLQIYLDFSAYSDMAIGMGFMIGFRYKENFYYPYATTTVTDFWRRWHISLGSFFRDYVYIPLGGNRRGMARQIFNLFIVWGLTGLWHGASWNYVLWGLYYFVFLVIEKFVLGNKGRNGGYKSLVRRILSHAYLLLIVYFGWILFKFTSAGMIGTVLKGMFCLNGNPFTSFETSAVLKNYFFFAIVAIIGSTPLIKNISKAIKKNAKTNVMVGNISGVLQIVLPVILLFLSTLSLVGDSYNPFLYFQF